jgi:large repetitive protein
MRLAVMVGLVSLVAVIATSSAAALAFTDDTRTLPSATLGSPYHGEVRARNGCSPYTFRTMPDAVLPPGLALTADGRITGAPGTQGHWQFWLAVDDSCGGESQRPFSIDVYPAPPRAEVGVAFTLPLQSSAAPDAESSWWIARGALPPGLTLASTGLVSGTPRAAGVFDLEFGVSNPHTAQTLPSVEVTLAISAVPTIASRGRLPPGRVGRAYSSPLRALGGTGPLTWKPAPGTGRLPPGIRLNGRLGRLLGVPRQPGRFTFAVVVRDALGQSATRMLALVVTRSRTA